MKLSRSLLAKAVAAKIITEEQADALFRFIENQPDQGPALNMTNVLYYLGGLIAIGAMTLFMNLGWEHFGGWGILGLSLLYAAIGLYLSSLFKNKNLILPAGICATFVIALTPLAIYGLQRGMGWWPDDTPYREYHSYIKWHWIFMELGTLIVGIILAWIYRYPFMVMPIAVTLWYLSMDLTSMITGDHYSFELGAKVSMYFGLLMILIAFWTDLQSRHSADYAFWLYLFGVMAFWGGLTCQHSDSEITKFIYLCLNVLMIGIGVILMRRVFVIFGALGCCIYLGHLASEIFKDSLLFPIALSLIGLMIIYLGTLWQKHENAITKKAQSLLPKALQELLQARH
ncbi:hypothetical protein [Legionella maceachernii]|uniref:Membrane protein n=1 Tax=Legionella maceachernii TaxID=466 RepID=A0A0W0WHP4_9GAMM|nr:hypothetical protein [Legionella maceachernii]KTD31806.1 membrane protein [Legionella maceachernii]SJZ98129.1 hypothetical protein SAMN02745128_01642 [Legionella maceachernii]SUP01128.1 Uncharacterised protein [Legionella maceachernii]